MPLAIAKKIVDELASTPAYRNTKCMNVGENGDCWISRDAIEILRYIKLKRPDISVHCYTDVQFFTRDKIEIVMREKLLDFCGVNVDGATRESFRAVKRLDSKYVETFIPTFIELRDKYNAATRLSVLSLTMKHYTDAVRTHLGKKPRQVIDRADLELKDDFETIKELIIPLLREGDSLQRSIPMFWSERDSVDTSTLDYGSYTCPLIQRVLHEAFIAPNGEWYPCCFDSRNELVLGNVYETSLYEVEHGEVRKAFINKLLRKQFAEIGGPCATVNCCQFGIPEPLSRH